MEAYQQRVLEEESQLFEKTQKLDSFMTKGNSKFDALPSSIQYLMLGQSRAMKLYHYFLAERIKTFFEEVEPEADEKARLGIK